jgi:hypothetical protein
MRADKETAAARRAGIAPFATAALVAVAGPAQA